MLPPPPQRPARARGSGGFLTDRLTRCQDEGDFHCLYRATNGKKKVSCVVPKKDYARFQTSYMTVVKASMDALKKRQRDRGGEGRRKKVQA